MTPVIVTDGNAFTLVRRSQDRLVGVGDFLFELEHAGAVAVPTTTDLGDAVSTEVVVPLEHGIHARPAAMLAHSIKAFASDVTLRGARTHGQRKEPSGYDVARCAQRRHGDESTPAVRMRARRWPRWKSRIRDGYRKPDETPSRVKAASPRAVQKDGEIKGVIACRGLAAGHAVLLERPEIHVEEAGIGVSDERKRLERALERVKARLQGLAGSHQQAQREIVGAHVAFLEDPELLASAGNWIERGKSAGYAWRATLRANIDALRASGDDRIAERVDDLLDLESQVLLSLAENSPDLPAVELPERAILLAGDLLPSQLVSLDASRLAGICVASGGATSHVAILAAAMDIPTLVAMGPAVLEIREGSPLVIDADAGCAACRARSRPLDGAPRRARRSAARAVLRNWPPRNANAARPTACASRCSRTSARSATRGMPLHQGAEGCGLLRTEFLFLDRKSRAERGRAAGALPARSSMRSPAGPSSSARSISAATSRSLTSPCPREDNPALGLRGIRVSLQQPDLLREQLTRHTAHRWRGALPHPAAHDQRCRGDPGRARDVSSEIRARARSRRLRFRSAP